MIHLVRLVTIHPLFVHFTIGAMPILLLTYAMAAWLRSEPWTFAADVTAGVSAMLTLFTLAFGLVSNAYVGWPGGLGFWRHLHMSLGVATTFLIVVLAVSRLAMRQRGQLVAGYAAFGLAVLVAIAAGAAGWVGGEILTYTAGMAVEGAGEGSLSPLPAGTHQPTDLMDAMGQARADWGAATSDLARMVVQHPTDANFADIARRAARLQQAAAWIAANGARTLPRPDALVGEQGKPAATSPPSPGAPAQSFDRPAIRPVREGAQSAPDADESGTAQTRARRLQKMAKILQQRARALRDAAERKDIVEVARQTGAISEECAECHKDLRWRSPSPS